MEPSLKISETESKPLSQCSRSETEKLLNTLLEKQGQAAFLPHDTIYMQLQGMIDQVEFRLGLFDSGYLKDTSASKKIRRRISLIDDD
jgi:hypothetical protein